MVTKNDITGDVIRSKTHSEKYSENFDNIFNKTLTRDGSHIDISVFDINYMERHRVSVITPSDFVGRDMFKIYDAKVTAYGQTMDDAIRAFLHEKEKL